MGLLLLASLPLMPAERCQGYIMPAEQLIAFMAKNFSKFQTVIIIHSVQQEDESGELGEGSFMEKIWMQSPDLFHAEILDHSMGRRIEPDSAYRQLCFANSGEGLVKLLSKMGINVKKPHKEELNMSISTVSTNNNAIIKERVCSSLS